MDKCHTIVIISYVSIVLYMYDCISRWIFTVKCLQVVWFLHWRASKAPAASFILRGKHLVVCMCVLVSFEIPKCITFSLFSFWFAGEMQAIRNTFAGTLEKHGLIMDYGGKIIIVKLIILSCLILLVWVKK